MLVCLSRGIIDVDAKYTPTLLNTAIYLLGLSQQVSTFVINFQGRPFREGIRENSPLFYGLLGASVVAYAGATEFFPELNEWLQLYKMTSFVSHDGPRLRLCVADRHPSQFRVRLTLTMALDFAGCWLVHATTKYLFASLEPAEIVTRGRERREARRAEQKRQAAIAAETKALEEHAASLQEKIDGSKMAPVANGKAKVQ